MSNYSPSATLPEQLRANLAIVELFRNQARQCLETAERIDRTYHSVAEMLRAQSRDYEAQAARIEATLNTAPASPSPSLH